MHGRKDMPDKDHWDSVYRDRAGDDLSWYQARAEQSLALINKCGLDREAPLIDIGGGTSSLAAELLQQGYRDVSVLDISPVALANARAGLGCDAARVHWIEADVTKAHLPAARFALWHDRAVFHFLTAQSDRSAYVDTLRAALRPGGDVIIATFAEDGPDHCSGLPVERYDAAKLQAEFAGACELVQSEKVLHRTPTGALQAFRYCHFRRRDG